MRDGQPDTKWSLDRRELLAYSAAFGSAFLAAQGLGRAEEPEAKPQPTPAEGKQYPFKKSINLWAFSYPDKMTLKECLELAKRGNGKLFPVRWRYMDLHRCFASALPAGDASCSE